MAKRKRSFSNRKQRENDKLKKREKRQNHAQPDDVSSTIVPVPCGTEDGAVSALPGNPPGIGLMGYLPNEEKPLARVQASPRVKMHPTAPRLSPRGSRLFVQKGKAPSTDSPPWVCAPPRAPGPDTVHVSGPAGQAQLDTSWKEETSRISKDDGTKTISKQYSESITNSINIPETIYENQIYDVHDSSDDEGKPKKRNAGTDWDEETRLSIGEGNLKESKTESERITNKYENEDKKKFEFSESIKGHESAESILNEPSKEGYSAIYSSVQGTFHQADNLFGDNAGTQCVANCLVGLSYHKLKDSQHWTTMDMNKILVTGDELYTYLQRSSSMNHRYLLVDELPQFYECFGRSFEFRVNDSVASVILPDSELNLKDFDALPLDEALHVALTNTDGCFVCFAGNAMLIGRTGNYFFTFDSHSRSVDGMLNVCGKSTRILFRNETELLFHLQNLAGSMNYKKNVECNLTGVHCNIDVLKDPSHSMKNSYIETTTEVADFPEQNIPDSEQSSDDLTFVCCQQESFRYTPLNANQKMNLCHHLNIPYMSTENSESNVHFGHKLTTPAIEKQIEADGNCFFRAISYSVTNVEDFHNEMRTAVCTHLVKHKELFKQLLRNDIESLETHLSSSQMLQEGTWATEVEIYAMSHLLGCEIYTYSDGRWLKFSIKEVQPSVQNVFGAIYLNHRNENHYNVVLDVAAYTEINTELPSKPVLHANEYSKRNQNRKRMHEKRMVSVKRSETVDSSEKRRQSLRKKYKENNEFREKKLFSAFERYRKDDEFRAHMKMVNIKRYAENEVIRTRMQVASIQKYATDLEHQKNVKMRSVYKYKTDPKHKENVKMRINHKYKTDSDHQEKVKKRSVDKYKTDPDHKGNVKKRSVDKYKTDPDHKGNVKKRSVDKYRTDHNHKENVKKRSISKYRTNPDHREKVKKRSVDKYKTDSSHKLLVNDSFLKKYRENPNFRADKLQKAALKYKTDETFRLNIKDYNKRKKTNQRILKQTNLQNENEIVKVFKEKSKEGIDYSCCCCDRLLFANQVQRCEKDVYAKNSQAAHTADLCIQEKYRHQCMESCPENCTKSRLWICFTCHRKIKSGNVPAEAAFNKMNLEDIPDELKRLNSLEKHLIAIHIPFMKVMALPRGGQKNIHGPVVCVPSDLTQVGSLPSKQGEDLLLKVKLKRKLNYKGYFEYQFVNPQHVKDALHFLKENNHWYEDIVIDANWNPTEEGEVKEDEQNTEQLQIASDTCLQPVDIAQEVLDHYFDDIYDIAPGEGENPVRMLQEPGNEAKTFPYLFPSGNLSWNEERDTRITLARYFNNRLMNSDDRFAKDNNYIFFCQYMSDLNQVIEKTQISIRKSVRKLGTDQMVTSSMVQDPDVLSKLMRNDEALRFMQPIRGTPAYWASAQKDLFAMLRQLGIPTWFCSFSAAEHRWNDAVASILRQQNDNRNPETLDWSDKNEVLRTNPVTVARMFEHRFHVFQTEVIFSPAEPIGKVTDYFQRVEFQQRGSPHMHCLYWIENAPKLDEDGENAVCKFIDKYVSCALPSENEDLELRNTVLDVQQHSKNHSKSCRKKGTDCRFNFPRPPSLQTFITSPANESDSMDEAESTDLKKEQLIAKNVLLSVWHELQDETKDFQTTEEIFAELNLTQEQYQESHNKLTKKTTVVLQRNPDELWTNQYNPCLLKCWNANIDIQFVLDPFSCIVYIISYISKSEREMGMLLKQTKIEAEEGNDNARKTLKKIGSAYLNHREVSAQEAVYRVCNLKMKECSRKVVFVPVGENPTRLTKPLSQMKRKGKKKDDDNVEDDDDDIWLTNIVERYENRPDDKLFENMCLADFCSEYRVLSQSQVPTKPNENVFKLQNSKGYIQRRTRTKPAVVRYPRFNSEKMSEKYYQCLLQLFLPYRTFTQLKPPGFDLYQAFYDNGHVKLAGKRNAQPVKSIVSENQERFAQNEDVIAKAQETFEMVGEPEDAWANISPETELMRQECSLERNNGLNSNIVEELPDMQNDTNYDVLYKVVQNKSSREEMSPMLQKLNETQTKVFYLVREWCLKKSHGAKVDPLHIFITGGAGTGKSHLIKAIHYEASRLLAKTMSVPDSVSVLLSAFTGTAAFNIGGNTIHHLFSLPKFMSLPYEPLREQSLSEMRVSLGDLQILVIDEVSMVYKRLLYYIHERLVQIKRCKEPFGGVSVIAVGDFYQLPPVKQRKDERLYKENSLYPVDFWLDMFKVVELTEIMRQQEDIPFASALNTLRSRVCEASLDEKTTSLLNECIREGPDDTLHVYSTNDEVNAYNMTMLRKSCDELVEINALDYSKDNTSGKLVLRNKPMAQKKTDSLNSSLLMGINARVMLTRNVNVEDGLVNGVMGNVTHFVYGQGSKANTVLAVGVTFDNHNVGKNAKKKTKNGNIVLIERVHEDLKENKTKSVVRHQFPLRLSWACTAHKVQGMTVKKVVVNLDKTFSPGQAYVALSRVTSKGGLFIETCDPQRLLKKIYADPEVKTALQNMPILTLPEWKSKSEEGIQIFLLNIQSLQSHFDDFINDNRWRSSDVISLTETWLRPGHDVQRYDISGYHFHHVSRGEAYDDSSPQLSQLQVSKGGGVAVYTKETSNIRSFVSCVEGNIEGISVQILSNDIAILLVYRPSCYSNSQFLSHLQRVIESLRSHQKSFICLGDFNEDAKGNGPIQMFMTKQGLKQLVDFNTTEGATILDHVYVSSSIHAEVQKVSTYYSYHDALIVTIFDKLVEFP